MAAEVMAAEVMETVMEAMAAEGRLRHGQGTARRMRAAMIIARRQFSHYENPLWYEAEN
jgi:hypothetical protein